MVHIYWDSSSLAKRYGKENGSETVNAIFSSPSVLSMSATILNYAETSAILRRGLNRGDLLPSEYQLGRVLLQTEVFSNPGFQILSLVDADYLGGIALTDRHNINSADATILAAYLRHSHLADGGFGAYCLVCSDKRLLRAAAAEGLRVLNPETIAPADLAAHLA